MVVETHKVSGLGLESFELSSFRLLCLQCLGLRV